LGSTSPSALAARILEHCLNGASPPEDLLAALLEQAAHSDMKIAAEASHALFRILVERLSDEFEPRLCDVYAALFAEVIPRILPQFEPVELIERYRRIRRPRRCEGRARNVFVLSRVTLGADVAITSIVLDAAKKRFPDAEIHFVGARKAWELFAADPRVRHLPVSYGRGATLRDRLAVWEELRTVLARPHSVVIDPDSRLTQLGLLPVCPEENYFFFESRSYGSDSEESLSHLTRRWVAETFGVDGVPYAAPEMEVTARPGITVSLGVGENPAKRIPDPFEEQLLRELAKRDAPIMVDKGAGGEEAERVERAIARCGVRPGRIATWHGAFAPFAARIACGRLYVGYDSAGQHVAAACGVPLVSVFAGFVCPRMFARWHPAGSGPMEVVRVTDPDPSKVLDSTLRAVDLVRFRR
jgi:ADP-heptose:LPS heptosyltransferase